ncbi:MAG: hypothetical protein RL272_495 [Candidatus Parcubacteria bacterium]|jgi:prepilin-type N-terminal cleavage/methylation domain-containing protein
MRHPCTEHVPADRRQGFTLLEVLLTVSIIGILAGASLPIYQRFQVRNDLDVAAMTAVQSLRRAQTYSQAVAGDSPWGVSVQSGAIVLFKGSSYAARDPAFDESFGMPSSVSASGATDVTFSAFTGLPQTTGTLTLTAAAVGEARTVTVNGKGMVDY